MDEHCTEQRLCRSIAQHVELLALVPDALVPLNGSQVCHCILHRNVAVHFPLASALQATCKSTSHIMTNSFSYILLSGLHVYKLDLITSFTWYNS